MTQYITGRFPDHVAAERALAALRAAGFAPTDMDTAQSNQNTPDTPQTRQGNVLITVDAAGREDEARQIMRESGAEDIGERAATGMPPRTAPIIPNSPQQPTQPPIQRRDNEPGKLPPDAHIETQGESPKGQPEIATGGFDAPDHPITDADIIAAESARRQQQPPDTDYPQPDERDNAQEQPS